LLAFSGKTDFVKTRNWIVGLFILGFIVGVNAQDDSINAGIPAQTYAQKLYAQTPTTTTVPDYQPYQTPTTTTVPDYQPYQTPTTTTVPDYQPYQTPTTTTVPGYQPYQRPTTTTVPGYQPEVSSTPESTIPHLHTITPNAYGLGVNSDEYGRPQTYRTQDGKQLDPIFQSGVKQDAYGLGVGMDQFGRPVHSDPP
jgi:hypothetical protein